MSGRSKKAVAVVPSSPPASPAGEMPEAAGSHSVKSECPATGLNDRWLVSGIFLFLAAITFAVLGQKLVHEFFNYDGDIINVYDKKDVMLRLMPVTVVKVGF
jgi:hypothetical protein